MMVEGWEATMEVEEGAITLAVGEMASLTAITLAMGGITLEEMVEEAIHGTMTHMGMTAQMGMEMIGGTLASSLPGATGSDPTSTEG